MSARAATTGQPLGLRERKKRQQRAQIIQTAHSLFRDRPFNRVSMNDIAASADVSVGTVYNYFSTKSRLLLEVIGTFDVDLIDRLRNFAELADRPTAQAVEILLAKITEDAFSQLHVTAWRYAAGNSMIDAKGDVGVGYAELNRRLYGETVGRLLAQHKMLGKLPATFDVEAAGDVFEIVNNGVFRSLLAEVPPDMSMYRRRISRYVNLILPDCE